MMPGSPRGRRRPSISMALAPPPPPASPRSPKRKGSVAGNGGSSRVPETLQTVFIRSNRGQDVAQPPPQHVAAKTFSARNIFGTPRPSGKGRRRSVQHVAISGEALSLAGNDKPVVRKSLQELRPVPISNLNGDGHISPQAYVTSVLKNRGYSTNEYNALTTAYHNKPTPVQVASYGRYLVEAVRDNDVDTLRELFELGLSPNACNQHGESIVHTACRLGKVEAFQVMLDFGCQVSVADDYGRTPLHDACWGEKPNFDLVELILTQDPHLLYINDGRGSSPLSYIPRMTWTEWTRFFMDKKDSLWPQRDLKKEGFKAEPERTQQGANTRPVPHALSGLSFDLIGMVAEGSMDAADASYRKFERESGTDFTCDESYSSDSSDDDEDYTEIDDESSVFTFDEAEMAEILGSIGRAKPVAWSSRNSIELPKM